MSKIRKVYNLRKTSNIKPQSAAQPQQSRVSQFRQEPQPIKENEAFDKNISTISLNYKDPQQSRVAQEILRYQVEQEELSINKLQLNFDVPLNDIDKQDVKIKNIGNSAVYVQFNFKNQAKINQNGFKDTKIKFYCHYETAVIKPGQQSTFIFSFLSEFPGSFTEEVQISCKPPLKTPIPNLKLNGNAFIKDEWEANRKAFSSTIDDVNLRNQVQQILSDIVNRVKLPPPPLPDVKDPKVAEQEFQSKNAGLNLFYNEYLHKWFDQLFHQICQKSGLDEAHRYWDQSVDSLRLMIDKSPHLDEVDKKCMRDRLQHYCYLSMTPLPNKSDLYSTVYEFVSEAAYALGGDYVDAARKELDMWQVPFREPLENDTPEDLKARKEEVDKIKAEWLKKAKKKKWSEEDQKEMINQFKRKVQAKTTQHILNKFQNFEESAQFIKTREFLKKSNFKLDEYHKYLERIKTVRECPLDGKKVLIKWHLKLKQNCEDKLKELEEYLTKKKQLEKRLEEEKKQGVKKKKTVTKPKRKGQKEQQEQKPLLFDFTSILDEENWNGFTETFRVVMEKQPYLILIGITYGPRAGRHIPEHSTHFILEHLKTLESSIEFFPHQELSSLKQKIENEVISQGSILLLENLNFLPHETCQEEVVEPAAEEDQPPTITKRKLLQPQIRQFFDNIGESVDVIVNEDRYSNKLSGFTAYLNKEVLMGTQWWKYIALSTRVIDSTVILGGDFTPNTYLLLARLLPVVREVHLTGKAGVKFYLVKNQKASLGDITLGTSQKQAIEHILQQVSETNNEHKIKHPCDCILSKAVEESSQQFYFDGSQEIQGGKVVDIGEKTIDEINKISQGHLFILGQTSVQGAQDRLSVSLTKVLKGCLKKQEAKRQRHTNQSSTPAGIDYTEDLVIYFVGIEEHLIEKTDLKDKKVKNAEEEEQVEQEEEEGENDKKKVDLVSDFRLSSLRCLQGLWSGKFDLGVRDIDKYLVIQDD